MLSFMKESESQRPVNTSETGNAEPLTVAGRQKGVRNSTLVVAILFGVGVAALLLMVRQSRPKTASAAPSTKEDKKIEEAISRLTGVRAEMKGGLDHIVRRFYEFSDVLQVGVNELSKNPFSLESCMQPVEVQPQAVPVENKPSEVVAVVETPPTVDPMVQAQQEAEQAEQAKQRAIQQAHDQIRDQARRRASEMRLQTVFQAGSDRRCMVDDRVLRVGDTVRGFRIGRIGDASIELVWDSNEPVGTQPGLDLRMVLKMVD